MQYPARRLGRLVWLAVASVALAAESAANTVQDFDTAGSAYVFAQHESAPGPSIVAGGPTGSFARLAEDGVGSQLNSIAFDRTDKGAFCTIAIDLDFRITPSGSAADGFGVAWLDTAPHEEAGAVSGPAEEPNFAGSVGVGVDIRKGGGDVNDNHVSVHYDGSRLMQVDVSSVLDLDATAGQFARLRVVISVTTSGGTVNVSLRPPGGGTTTVVNAFPVPGLRPHEARLQVQAATGNGSADHDIDNVLVQHIGCPTELGEWGSVLPWPVVAIHAGLLPTGQVLIWDRDDVGAAPPHLFDPETETVTTAADPGLDVFCSGHSLLADGRLFVTGGHDGGNGFGLPDAHIYDPWDGTWSLMSEQMNAGRWYPTNLTLPNGDVLVVAGTITPGVDNPLPQVFEVATETWRSLTGAVMGVPLYTMTHQAPDGRVAAVGPSDTTWWLDTSGTGQWQMLGSTGAGPRDAGTSVHYGTGDVLLVGGGNPPLASAQVIDLGDASPAWRNVSSMAYTRRHLNSLILPDGSVLVSGGTTESGFNDATGAVFTPELWDPETETFTRVAGHQVPRLYHSFSVLLPDGRVLIGGGGHPPSGSPDFDHFDAEIYSPAYLFQGPRPVIDGAPQTIGYGDRFRVDTADAANVTAVHLVRLSSVTHSFNQNQRIHRATFATGPGRLWVDAPETAIEAPPGHYMLFLLNAEGVPSEAQIIQVLSGFVTPVPSASGPSLAALALLLVAAVGAAQGVLRRRQRSAIT